MLLLYMLYFFTGMAMRESVLKVCFSWVHALRQRSIHSLKHGCLGVESIILYLIKNHLTSSAVVVDFWSGAGCAQVNGSRIRSWWIQHHYYAIFTVAVLLMLPVDSPAVQFTVNKFLWWAWWQAIIMVLQNRCASTMKFLGLQRSFGISRGRKPPLMEILHMSIPMPGHCLCDRQTHMIRAGTSARGCTHA